MANPRLRKAEVKLTVLAIIETLPRSYTIRQLKITDFKSSVTKSPDENKMLS